MEGFNANNLMENELKRVGRLVDQPRLLLHCCCAPCACHVLVRLAPYFRITALYENPNIEPEAEYNQRAEELARFLKEYPFPQPVELVVAPYDNGTFRRRIAGLEKEPEGGSRCRECFLLRLGRTAALAEQQGYDCFTTTLSTGSRKDARVLHEIGCDLESETLRYLPADFKKKGGALEAVRLSRAYGLYRQDYCGCVFSKREKEERNKRYGV